MVYLYVLLAGLIVAVWLYAFRVAPRLGCIVTVLFASFALPAIPVHFIPVSRIHSLLTIGMTGFALAYGWFLNKDRNSPFLLNCSAVRLPVALFFVGCISLLLFTSDRQYGTFKLGVLLMDGIMPLTALAVLGPYHRREARWIISALALCAFLAALYILAFGDIYSHRGGGRAADGHLIFSPIEFPRLIGYGVLVLSIVGLYQLISPRSNRWKYSIPAGIGAIGLFIVMLLPGTRGPVLALFGTLLISGLLLTKNVARYFGFVLLTTAALAILIVVLNVLPGDYTNLPGVERVEAFVTNGWNPDQDRARVELFRAALHGFIRSNFIGVGIGDFGNFIGSLSDKRSYPHNLFLEVAVEQGIIALSILVVLVFMGARETIRLHRVPGVPVEMRLVSLVWIFALLNAQVSGDLGANASLFAFIALPTFILRSVVGAQLKPRKRHLSGSSGYNPRDGQLGRKRAPWAVRVSESDSL